MRHMLATTTAALALLIVTAACSSPAQVCPKPAPDEVAAYSGPYKINTTRYVVNKKDKPDKDLVELVAPYQAEVQGTMDKEIGEATGNLIKGKNDSLGKFLTDVMLARAKKEIGPEVAVAVTNVGGLRAPIDKGPITVGDIYAVMPFDNLLMVVTLTGEQLQEMADRMAKSGGEPVAGMTFTIAKGKAENIVIGGAPFDPSASYKVACTDYLLSVKGRFDILQEGSDITDTKVFLRTMLIEAIEEMKVVDPPKDVRIEGATS